MDETRVRTSLSKYEQQDESLTSTALTSRILDNLNVLKCKLDHDLVNNSRLYHDEKNDFGFNKSKPFVLKFVEQKNKLFRNQVNHENISTISINTISKGKRSSIKKRKFLPKLNHTERLLAIIPKTGAVNKILIDDQIKQQNPNKTTIDSSNECNIDNQIHLQFNTNDIHDQLKIISYCKSKQMKFEASYPNTNVDITKNLTNLIQLDPKEEIAVSEYQDGDFTTTGIQGKNKFDYNLIRKKTIETNTMKRKHLKSLTEKVPILCSNTTKKCCSYGIREPIEPWFPLDSLLKESSRINQKTNSHLRLNRSKSCDINNFKLPWQPEFRNLYHSSPNLMNQPTGDLVINQNFSSMLHELTQQRKLILDMEDQTIDNLEDKISPEDCNSNEKNKIFTIIHSKDDCIVHTTNNHMNDLETISHTKSMNISNHHDNKTPQNLNNPPIITTQLIHLNLSDIELYKQNQLKINNNNNNNLKIDWIKIIKNLPENIEPILEYFGSTKQDQYTNIKLVTNEIENLTYEINKNPSTTKLGFDLCRRGALYRKIGRLQDAKADLLKSIQIESKLSSAYWHIHFIFLLEGKIKEALYHLEQCMKCTNMIEPIQNFTTTTKTMAAAAMVTSTTTTVTTTMTAAAAAMTTTTTINTTDNRNNNSNMKSFNTNLYQFYHDILNSKAFIYSLLNDSKMEIEIWTKLIHYNPTYELAYEKRANLYLKLKMYHQANTDFMKILCINPKSIYAQFQCGLYKFHSKDWRTAISYFKMVLVNNPSYFEARYYLARSLLKLSNYNTALAELTTCLYFQPMYYKALYIRGCLLTKTCPLQSLRDLTLCIYVGNQKYQTMAFIQRGLMFNQLKRYKMAIHDFQAALNNGSPQSTDIYRLLGLTYIQLNLTTRAIQAYTNGIKKETIPDIKLLLCRAEAYYQSNQFNKAIFDIQRVIHLSPYSATTYLLLANYLYKLTNAQLVQRSIQQYLSLAEDYVIHKQAKQMALAYYYLKKYKEAETILSEDTKHQLVLSNILLLGLIMDKQQKTMNSIELLVNSLKKLNCKKLEKIEIYNHLGQYYMKIGDYIPAIQAFTNFIHYDPHRPHVYLYRAQSTCRLIAIHLQKRTILPTDFNDNVLDDISQALVLIHSKKSSVDQIHLNGPMKYVDLIDQCLLTRIIYFGINQRYTKAILNCNEVIHRRSEWTRIWIYRGVFKYLLKTMDFCEADLNIAIEKDQKSSLAYYNRGLCRQTQDKWNDAIEDYDQAVKTGTLNGSVQLYSLINRSIIYIEKCQDYHKAIKDLYQAKTIMDKLMNSTIQNETNSDLFIKLMYTIGICHQRLEMYPEAEQILHNLTIQQPNFLKGYIAYANCLMDYEGYKIKMNEMNSINLWNQALNVYEFALKLDKYNLEASIGLSMCLQVLGRLNDALKQITHTLNIYYNHHESNYNELTNEKHNKLLADAYDCRGIIYLQLGRSQYAIDDLTNSIRLNRYSTKYLINRGVAYFCNHQIMPAMIDFKNANQLDSTNDLAYYHQALIYLHHGQFDQAENLINLIINMKQSPSFITNQLQSICLDPSLWLLRSIIKLMKHKSNDYYDSILKEALNDVCYAEQLILPKLMNELTSWPHLHYTKGQILCKLKDYIKADKEFTKALSLLPSNKYIYQIRCKCREEMYRTGLSNSYENALIDYRLSLLANDVTNQ
ncbi:unnamed protein product [Schistosoma margrebowiei]|uniref:UDP-N-acetylglucosamine--peptide N-acetylglucosaminyltransferase SPINDLY n=1 Tax=Schistosoma margrebowiei TaxID=48269 RepID=A0AA85A0W5_9TREM|nr:unnamed protein product [Schistosoma margrebowiei]